MNSDPVSYQVWKTPNATIARIKYITTGMIITPTGTGCEQLNERPGISSNNDYFANLAKQSVGIPAQRGFLCTAMVLNNLANPMWFSVPCDKKVAKMVFCHMDKAVPNNPSQISLSQHVCPRTSFKLNNTCFAFLWSNAVVAKRIHFETNPLFHNKRHEFLVKVLDFVLDAVDSIVPPVFAVNFEKLMSWS